jgi:hypothetical protein
MGSAAYQAQQAERSAAKKARKKEQRRGRGSAWVGSLLTLLVFAASAFGATQPAERRDAFRRSAFEFVAVRVHRAKLALGLTSAQRCPAEGDRFRDHCVEGRNHYQLTMDWECFGPRRADAMRIALDIELPLGQKFLHGKGEVSTWLTAENAVTVKSSPCISGAELDLSCQHCKPTPKRRDADKLRAEAAAAEEAAGVAEEEREA